MKKYLIIMALVMCTIPSVTFAAWWNPFSWFNKMNNTKPEQSQAENLNIRSGSSISTEEETGIRDIITTKFYIKYNNSRVRECESIECNIIGYYNKNQEISSTSQKNLTLSDLPAWIPLSINGNSTAYINKSVLSETPIQTTNITQTKNDNSNSSSVTEKSQTNTKSPTRTETYIKLSNLNDYIDVLIEGHKNNIKYTNEIIEAIDYLYNDFNEARMLSLKSKATTEPVYIDTWKFIITSWDFGLKEIEETRNTLQGFNQITENKIIHDLQKEKESNILTDTVDTEVYINHYSKLKSYYEAIDKNKETISDTYDTFKSKIIKLRHDTGSLMLAVAKKELDHAAYEIGELKSLNNSVYETQTYKPILYPQIQIPKTTYCNMSGGIGGNYSIICN